MKFNSSPNRPSDWKEMNVAEICKTFTSGGTPSRKKSEYFENGTIPWVRTKELDDGVITEVEQLITPEALENSSAKILPKNTVLLAMYGATVGKLGILGIDSACNQACAAMVPKEGVVDYKFLFYLLLKHRDSIVNQATGAAQQNLSGEIIKRFTFDFPTYENQKVISEILWSLDEKISANNALSKTLESIAQSIFKSWFIDFDPVHAKSRGEKPFGMDDETAALFPDSFEESELGMIPKGWAKGHLGDHVSPKKGKSITKKSTRPGEIPVVAGGLEPAYFHDTPNSKYPSVTISASGANAGFVRLYLQDIWASDCSVLNSENTSHPYFWYLLLKYNQELIYSMQQGAAQPHIYPSDLMRIPTVTASRELLNKFENITTAIFMLVRNNELNSMSLSEIRDFLLPRLISGELQIPEELLVS